MVRVRVRGRVVAITIHCQQILCDVGVKKMHCRAVAHAPRSNPTRAIPNFFHLKIEET